MSDRVVRCLQCGQSCQEVKINKTFCATVVGYEVVETRDVWERHHWRDWSNAELKDQGLHPSLWEKHRRTDIYGLEWPMRESICIEKGHNYPEWHPPMHKDRFFMYPPNLCICCYEKKEETP